MRGAALLTAVLGLAAVVGAGSLYLTGAFDADAPVVAAPSPTATPDAPSEEPATPTPTSPSPTDEAPSPSPSATPTQSPSPMPSPTPSPTPTPRKPDPEVMRAQELLTSLGYYGGAVDGFAGAATASATMAFQKVNGLKADGIIGPNTLAALDAPVAPTLHGGAATRVEVDLTRQVAYYVEDGTLRRIFPVSSGSGETYVHSSGGKAVALTPVGAFKVQRKIDGVREAPLGVLYDPMYFHRGWALHGSNYVPAYPASHGCVRLPRWDARWLFNRVPTGTQVLVYGGTHTFRAGEELSEVGTTQPGGDETGDPSQTESPSPSPSPSPSGSPTQSPTPTPTPTPAPTPTPSPSPSGTTSPSPSPTPSPSSSPSETSSPTPPPSGTPSPSPTP